MTTQRAPDATGRAFLELAIDAGREKINATDADRNARIAMLLDILVFMLQLAKSVDCPKDTCADWKSYGL
jgi:hypothetical protein